MQKSMDYIQPKTEGKAVRYSELEGFTMDLGFTDLPFRIKDKVKYYWPQNIYTFLSWNKSRFLVINPGLVFMLSEILLAHTRWAQRNPARLGKTIKPSL